MLAKILALSSADITPQFACFGDKHVCTGGVDLEGEDRLKLHPTKHYWTNSQNSFYHKLCLPSTRSLKKVKAVHLSVCWKDRGYGEWSGGKVALFFKVRKKNSEDAVAGGALPACTSSVVAPPSSSSSSPMQAGCSDSKASGEAQGAGGASKESHVACEPASFVQNEDQIAWILLAASLKKAEEEKKKAEEHKKAVAEETTKTGESDKATTAAAASASSLGDEKSPDDKDAEKGMLDDKDEKKAAAEALDAANEHIAVQKTLLYEPEEAFDPASNEGKSNCFLLPLLTERTYKHNPSGSTPAASTVFHMRGYALNSGSQIGETANKDTEVKDMPTVPFEPAQPVCDSLLCFCSSQFMIVYLRNEVVQMLSIWHLWLKKMKRTYKETNCFNRVS